LAKQILAKLVDMGFAKTSLLVVSGKGHATLFARTVRANAINADLLLSVHHDSVQDVYLERWTFNGKQQLFSD
jgi:N-acetylmuramoyl-L-alanine amidase